MATEYGEYGCSDPRFQLQIPDGARLRIVGALDTATGQSSAEFRLLFIADGQLVGTTCAGLQKVTADTLVMAKLSALTELDSYDWRAPRTCGLTGHPSDPFSILSSHLCKSPKTSTHR